MKIKKMLARILIISIFAYLFYRLYLNWGTLATQDFQFNYLYLILAILTFIFFYFLEGVGYDLFVKLVHARVPFRKVLKARYVSDMGRYIPGKVWTYLGRIYFLRKYDISKMQVLVSSLLEMALMVLGGVLIFLLSLIFWSVNLGNWLYLLLIIIPLIFISTHPKVLNKLLNIVERIRKKEQVKIKTKYSSILAMTLFYLFYWIVHGLGAFFVINAITPLSIIKLPIIMGIFAIAWVLGFVSFLAPGGLGIREGILAYFLIYLIPEPISIIVVLVMRVLLTVIEGLYALISLKF